MARKRKKHSNRKARRHGNPRRARRHHNRKRFRFFNRRRFGNPPDLGGLAQSLLGGAAGYIAAKFVAMAAEQYLPPSIPYPGLVGAGASAIAAAWAGETVLKGKPKLSAAVAVGATIPLAEEIIKMTPLGPRLGMFQTAPGAPSGGAASLPAPGGVDGDLAASLGAGLSSRLSDADDGHRYWSAYA
jgi:hypothetical protein